MPMSFPIDRLARDFTAVAFGAAMAAAYLNPELRAKLHEFNEELMAGHADAPVVDAPAALEEPLIYKGHVHGEPWYPRQDGSIGGDAHDAQ